MQKLVTIYFNNREEGFRYREVHEHLDDYLKDGWIVKMMMPVGSSYGAGGGDTYRFEEGTCGWLSVLLEK